MQSGAPSRLVRWSSRQAVFEITPVVQTRQRIPGGLFAKLLAQPQVEERQLDVLAHRNGERLLAVRGFPSAPRQAGEGQHAQGLALHHQRHAQIAGLRSQDEVAAKQAPLRVQDLVGLSTPHRPAVLQRKRRLLRGLCAPSRDRLEPIVRSQNRQEAVHPGKELVRHQRNDAINLVLRRAHLEELGHAVQDLHVAVPAAQLSYAVDQLLLVVPGDLLRLLARSHVSDVALDDARVVFQVHVAHELDASPLVVLGLERQILVADVLVPLELPEGVPARRDVLERSDFPELPANELRARVTEQDLQEGVGVGDLPGLRVENQDAVLRRLEEPPVPDLGLS